MKKNSIGILGGGQLCQMLAEYLISNGNEVYFIDPSPNPPAKHTKAIHIQDDYDDLGALEKLIDNCNVITYEFENIPLKSLEFLEKKINIYPSKKILSVAQNRLNEKNNFIKCGIKTPKFFSFNKRDDLKNKLKKENIETPIIIKTNTLGYDGKGQFHIEKKEEISSILELLDDGTDYIVEQKIKFKKEFSVIIGRNYNGEIFHFDPFENIHKNGILDISISPARIDQNTINDATELAKKFVTKNNLIGIIAIEMFLDNNNSILFNEIAPRPHNSGHLTIESHSLSQFGMLGKILNNERIEKPVIKKSSIMKNILGEFFINKDHKKILEKISMTPNHFVKMYNKDEPKIGRKMGHVTIFTENIERSIVKINKLID